MSERIKITVIEEKDRRETVLLHNAGETLLHTLREGGIRLPSLCGLLGKCGRCQVRFLKNAPLPTQADRALIIPGKLREGYRLACMARPRKECVVETAFGEEKEIDVVVESRMGKPQSENNRITRDPGTNEPVSGIRKEGTEAKGDRRGNVFVAADIGTTTIAMQLLEAGSGRTLDTYTCLNPQRSYGADVISRIQAGTGRSGETLQRLVREALEDGLGQMMERTFPQGETRKPVCMALSANTVMGHLFMGYPVDSLGRSPFLPVNIKTVALDYLGMPAILLPGISAFVGGDIVSGLYACGLYRQQGEKAWLFLDLGTNAEMVMGKEGRLVCTAAAAGPAFEGRGKNGQTGSERIHAIAQLLEKGIVDRTGLLQEPYFTAGVEVETENRKGKRGKTAISQGDIRDIQMAKAAIRAGIFFLMKKLEITDWEEIGKVYVAGGFGFYLDKKAAAGIGLIPEELEDKLEAVGNTSLAGARMIGRKVAEERLSGKKPALEKSAGGQLAGGGMGEENLWRGKITAELEGFAQKAEVFQLAEEPSFEERYIEYMNF